MNSTNSMNRSIFLLASLSCCLTSCAADYGEPDTDDSVEVDELSQGLALDEVVSFKNLNSQRCIGVDGASTEHGALVKQFTCDGALNQSWRAEGGLELVNVKSDKCMGVDGGSRNHGANIGQYNCDGAVNQNWIWSPVDGSPDIVRLVNENSFSVRCIGVDGGSGDNGAQLKQFRCDSSANQIWVVIPR